MKRRICEYSFTIVLIFVLQIVLIGSLYDYQIEKSINYFLDDFKINLWNMILMYLFYRILITLTNRRIVSWVLLTTIMIAFSISNFLKLKYRAEPVIPNDLTMINNIVDIISYLTKKDIVISVISIISICIFIGLTIIFNKQKVIVTIKNRIIHAICVGIVAIAIFAGNNLENNFFKWGTYFGYNNQFWSMEYHYITNGPLSSFLSIIDVIAMEEMKYDEEDLEFLEDYKNNPLSERTNLDLTNDDILIYILGESFIDPLRIENIKINKDPIPFIRNIMNDYTSGILYQSTLGGGTSKAEYEALTSFSNSFYHKSVSTPYQFPVPELDLHPMIGDLFDNSIAIHTLHAKLYRRVDVFNTFGFDKFKYLGSPTDDLIYKEKIENHPSISDMSGFKEILHTINTIPNDENAFIYLATMQNHTPYDKNFYLDVEFEIENDYDPEIKAQFEAYLKGLNETDKAMKYLFEELNKSERNITVVFFGDHYPPFAKQLVAKNENFKTDYFVYQNYQKTKLDYPFISTNFLSSVALKHMDIVKSPFYNFLDSLLRNFTVIHNETIVRPNESTFEPIDDYQDLKVKYDQFKVLQYDIVAGEQISIRNKYYHNDLN